MLRQYQLIDELLRLGFHYTSEERTGYTFSHNSDDICLIIDTKICTLQDYQYIDYTNRQNHLFSKHAKVLRLLYTENDSLALLIAEIQSFLGDSFDIENISRFGTNRTEQEIDPSLPEACFEDCFIEAFGESRRNVLHREFPYIDLLGTTRYIDYALFSKVQKFAIELNGESFHHPVVIGEKRYRSQLFKQNSLVSDGFKVYRWSMRGMNDRERFIQEIRQLFGDSSQFQNKSLLKLPRDVKTLELYEHQKDALQYLTEERCQGRRTFLVTLPTGTGKTEIFIEDLLRLKKNQSDLCSLIIVPTRNLRDQTLERLALRANNLNCSQDLFSAQDHDAYVQTSAYMHRHYFEIPPDKFDYIVVDEAHHAVASGLRKVLEHFTPEHLLGLTATPDRLDRQKLEEVFGEYESMLSLQEAVAQGLIPPIRCYRIKSNIDLSEVRFNGKEYHKGDLQKTLQVPSRDKLIIEVLLKYFSGSFSKKQGVIFCVDINHAKRMAKLLQDHGISSAAVSGLDRSASVKAQSLYDQGSIRFLCACDLLSEGWDSPRTSILVMARPTFSRVLYTQQLGRGTRHYPEKEALYVLDVVDNYGAKLQPLSLHALFGVNQYRPFDDVIALRQVGLQSEVMVLDGLYEGERRIEPINIFNFEEVYGEYLNEEQLARALFISTGTVKSWIKKGEIQADASYPFGRSTLSFFHPSQIARIRESKGLSEHTDETRKKDFFEFLENRDYTFSYKIIFLLAMLKIANNRGEASLEKLTGLYQQFYQQLYSKKTRNEKDGNPYNRPDFLIDIGALQRSLLQNPFEKFERKRFLHHCKDLNYIAFDNSLWTNLEIDDQSRIRAQMVDDLKNYYRKLNIDLESGDYDFLEE